MPATIYTYGGRANTQGWGPISSSGMSTELARKRSETKLIAEVKEKAQGLLNAGHNVANVSRETGVLATTLHKALRAKRLEQKKKRA